MPKTIAIIGASPHRERFSNKAIRAYSREGWKVYPVTPNHDEAEGLEALDTIRDVPEPLDRVSVYVRPAIGKTLIDDIAAAEPKEVFFNPGSEDAELLKRAKDLGLTTRAKCSIVDIGHSPSEFPDE